MSNSNNSTSGIGFGGLLLVVFITLKLLDKIAWSWWWVMSPLWIPLSFVLFIITFYLIVTRGK